MRNLAVISCVLLVLACALAEDAQGPGQDQEAAKTPEEVPAPESAKPDEPHDEKEKGSAENGASVGENAGLEDNNNSEDKNKNGHSQEADKSGESGEDELDIVLQIDIPSWGALIPYPRIPLVYLLQNRFI